MQTMEIVSSSRPQSSCRPLIRELFSYDHEDNYIRLLLDYGDEKENLVLYIGQTNGLHNVTLTCLI